MEKVRNTRPVYDERDEEIDLQSKSSAWNFTLGAAQIAAIMCVVKENPAWKSTLALIFLGLAANMICRFRKYRQTTFLAGGLAAGAAGAVLLVWFGLEK